MAQFSMTRHVAAPVARYFAFGATFLHHDGPNETGFIGQAFLNPQTKSVFTAMTPGASRVPAAFR